MTDTPFDNIESAHHYVTLLGEQLRDVREEIAQETALAMKSGESRRVDVLRLVDYKLSQLRASLSTSSRLLNDLRTLRRLILGEREDAPGGASEERAAALEESRA